MPPIPATGPTCACPLAGALLRSLDALAETAPLTYVEGGLETLALLGTQLDRALVTTNNGRSLLSGVGGFAAYQDNSSPFRISRRRLTFRVDAQAQVQLARTKGRAGTDSALTVADATGALTLRIETDGGYDGAVLAGLSCTARRHFVASAQSRVGENVVELSTVRAARANWADSDLGQHLNDFLQDKGHARRSALPYLGRARARRVRVEILPSFLSYLAEHSISHVRLVPGAGYLQGDIFQAGTPRRLDQILLLEGGQQSFALDLSQIGSLWVTYIHRAAQLEIYDKRDQIMGVLAQDPHADPARWSSLLEAFP